MVALPAILHDKKYKDTWDWDGWKPKAKPTAPKEVKEAISEWVTAIEKADSDTSDDSIIMQ